MPKIILLIFAVATVLLLYFIPLAKVEILLSTLASAILLVLGLALPMIEIDARISEMAFTIMSHEVNFSDQVLYFKSKSILEVVQLMLFQSKISLFMVGLLVLVFSVLFPFTKLLCTNLYLLKPQARNNRLVRFMTFKSSKWSMADVFVIAIFMAYLGFDGILSEQLRQLEGISPRLELLTTNNSEILFGFYAFCLFVLQSLFIAQRVQDKFSKT
jgi:uncharacterized paraquat-inducible protein A